MQKSEKIRKIIVCPVCKAPLKESDKDSYTCTKCNEVYPIVNGIPVLFSKKQEQLMNDVLKNIGKSMVKEYTENGLKTILGKLKPPSTLLPLEPKLSSSEMDFFYEATMPDNIVVSVGGGPLRHRDVDINLNIGLFPNVDIIGDGHEIPIADNSVDAVICKAVLEHVKDAPKIVSEIYRILKPGGIVYIDIPYLFITHYYPLDICRYTSSGIKQLMHNFKEIKTGISIGPFSTILILFNDFVLEIFGIRGKIPGKIFSGTFRLFTFPFKYLDLLYRKKTPIPDFSGGYHFIGTKE